MKSLFARSAVLVVTLVFFTTFTLQANAATLDELSSRLQTLQSLLDTYEATLHPAPLVKGASTIVVTNDAELANAIKGVTGGETIQLAPGNYSGIQIQGGTYNNIIIGAAKISKGVPTLSMPVIITSQDPAHPAVVKSIDVRTTNHWHFKGLVIQAVKNGVAAAVSLGGSDCSFEDSVLTYGNATGWTATDWLNFSGYGVTIYGANDIVRNNTIQNVYMGIEVMNTAVSSQITHNTLDGIGGDGMRLLANYVVADSNLIKNFKHTYENHDDCTQSSGISGNNLNSEGVVRGVVYQNNICLNNENLIDLPCDSTQRFDAFDGTMIDWVVQNNAYVSTAYWGISYSGAINMKIRNNTIIDSDPVVSRKNTVTIAVGPNKTGTIQPTGNTFEILFQTYLETFATSVVQH